MIITTREQTPVEVLAAAALWNEEKALHEEGRAHAAKKLGRHPSEVAVHRRDAEHHWNTAGDLRSLVLVRGLISGEVAE